jgi:hypothetical protein
MGEHKKNKVNWRIAADREVIGESIELATLPGCHVKPRRYSVSGLAEVQAVQVRAMAAVKSEALREVATAFEGKPISDDASAGLSAEQKREIMITIMESASADMIGGVEKKRAMLRYGIALHDFEGEWTAPTDEWAVEVMEREHVATEILAIVEEKNRPLASATPPTSETPPTGSTTESLTTDGSASSPTEVTP